MAVIVAEKLTKVFSLSKKKVEALRGVDLVVDSSIFSLLGRNGSGKTTFVRIASTLLEPTSGRIEVLGHDAVREPWPIRRRIAVLPQEGRPIDHLTPREAVMAYLLMRGWSLSDARATSRIMVQEFGLEEHADKPAWSLSGGLKRRVLLAMVFAAGADLIFLDEPTIGLDPHIARDVWGLILKERRRGASLFISSNNMEEAEALSDRVAIMDRGLILAQGTVKELIDLVPGRYRVEVRSGFREEELEGYGALYRSPHAFIVYTGKRMAEALLAEAVARGVEASIKPISLQDAFIYLTGGGVEGAG